MELLRDRNWISWTDLTVNDKFLTMSTYFHKKISHELKSELVETDDLAEAYVLESETNAKRT
jgi:hypothetical protein